MAGAVFFLSFPLYPLLTTPALSPTSIITATTATSSPRTSCWWGWTAVAAAAMRHRQHQRQRDSPLVALAPCSNWPTWGRAAGCCRASRTPSTSARGGTGEWGAKKSVLEARFTSFPAFFFFRLIFSPFLRPAPAAPPPQKKPTQRPGVPADRRPLHAQDGPVGRRMRALRDYGLVPALPRRLRGRPTRTHPRCVGSADG